MTKRERLTFLFLWFTLGFLPLMLRPLWEPDEARYAEIPREMLAKGDWLTPTLNQVHYFEKPPLQYWLSAISMKLFGLNALAARLPLALAWAMVMWCAWRLAKRLGARDPRWAMFMTATGLLAYVCGQLLTLDALFSACIVLAITAALESVAARMEDRNPLGWTLVAFTALAAGTLTKGPAAIVLAGGVLFFSLFLARKDARLRRAAAWTLLHPAGLVLLGLLTAPWFYFVDKANPGHARFFFIHEHVTRFTTHEHARQGSNNPVLDKFYFIAILAVGLLPWLSASLVGLRRGWAFLRSARGPQSPSAALNRWIVGTLVLAFAWPLFFFSVSGSKLAPYILPVLVPLMAMACAFEREGEELKAVKRMGWELVILGGIFAGAGVGFAKDLAGGAGWVLALGAAFAFYGAWCLRPKGLTTARMMALQGGCMLLLSYVAALAATPGKDVAPLVGLAPRGAQWISAGVYFQGLPLHARTRVTVVAGTGELAYGKDKLPGAEQARWFPEDLGALRDTAVRLAQGDPNRPVWVLIKDRAWKALPEEDRGAFEEMGALPGVLALRLRR